MSKITGLYLEKSDLSHLFITYHFHITTVCVVYFHFKLFPLPFILGFVEFIHISTTNLKVRNETPFGGNLDVVVS